MTETTNTATRLPPTQEEIDAARVLENVNVPLVIIWFGPGPMCGFCPCMFAADRVACLRQLRLRPTYCRPRARARRRRHGGSRRERGPPDDDDGNGPPPRSARLFWGKQP